MCICARVAHTQEPFERLEAAREVIICDEAFVHCECMVYIMNAGLVAIEHDLRLYK